TPDAVLLTGVERVLQAVGDDRAGPAQFLRGGGVAALLGEERVRPRLRAHRLLHPLAGERDRGVGFLGAGALVAQRPLVAGVAVAAAAVTHVASVEVRRPGRPHRPPARTAAHDVTRATTAAARLTVGI